MFAVPLPVNNILAVPQLGSHSLLLHFVFMQCLHGFFFFFFSLLDIYCHLVVFSMHFSFGVCFFDMNMFPSLFLHLHNIPCQWKINSFTITVSSNKQHCTSSNIAVQHTIFLVQIRYRKDRMQTKLKPYFPVVNEVKDLSNGCAIAAVIHHYCPGLLRLEGMVTFHIWICHFVDV